MRKIYMMLVFALLLAACGAAGPGAGPTPGGLSDPTSAPTDAPAEQPTAPPAPTGAPAEDDPVTAAARQQLAQQLGIEPQDLTLQSASAQEWPDTALGCPARGQVYAQVITPGFQLTFDANGQTYQLHTDANGANVIWCDGGQPTVLGAPAAQDGAESQAPTPGSNASEGDGMSQPIVDLAQQALASDLNTTTANVRVVSVTPTEWNDSSLGCPKPDMMYLQVITPGYQIVLEAQGQTYTYHTDTKNTVVRCDSRAPGGPASGM